MAAQPTRKGLMAVPPLPARPGLPLGSSPMAVPPLPVRPGLRALPALVRLWAAVPGLRGRALVPPAALAAAVGPN